MSNSEKEALLILLHKMTDITEVLAAQVRAMEKRIKKLEQK